MFRLRLLCVVVAVLPALGGRAGAHQAVQGAGGQAPRREGSGPAHEGLCEGAVAGCCVDGGHEGLSGGGFAADPEIAPVRLHHHHLQAWPGLRRPTPTVPSSQQLHDAALEATCAATAPSPWFACVPSYFPLRL